MELWIRSQDKDFLMKIDNINLGYQNDENNRVINEPRRLFTFVRDTSYTLGVYKTQERALEVLDEIQELLKQEDYLHITKSSLNNLEDIEEPKYILRSCGLPKVYEMPKE